MDNPLATKCLIIGPGRVEDRITRLESENETPRARRLNRVRRFLEEASQQKDKNNLLRASLIGRARHISKEDLIIERFQEALMLLHDTIEINQNKCGGTPVLKGTRFTLAQLVAELAEGRSVKELAVDFDLDLETITQFLEGFAMYLDRPAKR